MASPLKALGEGFLGGDCDYADVSHELKLDAIFASSCDFSYEEILTDMLKGLGLRTTIEERNPGIYVPTVKIY